MTEADRLLVLACALTYVLIGDVWAVAVRLHSAPWAGSAGIAAMLYAGLRAIVHVHDRVCDCGWR